MLLMQVCDTQDELLKWVWAIAFELGFAIVILRCPFMFRESLVKNGGWVVRVLYGSHNHDVAKTLVNHSYVGRLITNEKTIVVEWQKIL